jgi:RNA polymerase sigma-70 factor (ECF subfamily)
VFAIVADHSSACVTSSPEALSDEDARLMQAVAAGDRMAFRTLVEKHQHRVVGTVAKMLGDDRDAEDLAQHVFLRVWNSAARYEPRAKFTTWLFTITRNLVFNEIRRRDRSRADSLDARIEECGDTFTDQLTPSASDDVVQAELEAAVQAAIDALPPPQRLAVVLRRYEDLSYEEIADITNTSVAAVKSLLFRARASLKERLTAYLGR